MIKWRFKADTVIFVCQCFTEVFCVSVHQSAVRSPSVTLPTWSMLHQQQKEKCWCISAALWMFCTFEPACCFTLSLEFMSQCHSIIMKSFLNVYHCWWWKPWSIWMLFTEYFPDISVMKLLWQCPQHGLFYHFYMHFWTDVTGKACPACGQCRCLKFENVKNVY